VVIFPQGRSLKRSSQRREEEEEEEEEALVVAHFAAASAPFGIFCEFLLSSSRLLSVWCCALTASRKKTGNKEVEKSLLWTKKKSVARGGGVGG
jgi:hypothetical protein